MVKKLSLRDMFLEFTGKDYRSGRGTAVPAYAPSRDVHGDVPKPTPRTGQRGDPSSSFSVTASRIQQQHMEDDDLEYWDDIAFDPPYVLDRDSYGGLKTVHSRSTSESVKMLRNLVREILEEEDLEEISTMAGGAVAGYTLPLGMSNKKKKKKRTKGKSE